MTDYTKFRFPAAIIVGIFLSIFGVFIFGKFNYVGLSLQDNIFVLMESLETAADGFYQLLGSGFMVDLFYHFSPERIENTTSSSIFFGQIVWPTVLTWLMTGFIAGAIAKGPKRGLYVSLIIVFSVFMMWVITGFFAGEDMVSIYQNNITTRISELLTAIIFIIPSGVIAGLITGPYEGN